MRKAADLTGQRFGRLTVVREAESITYAGAAGRTRRFVVRCDCGSEKTAQMSSLRRGVVVSCGCYSAERSRKHGMEGTKVYDVWASMKARCNNPRHRAYANYGGRGIKVCERWSSFENFYADMGEPTGVLDRIDNNGNYEPGNCRWATWSVSNQNQRRNLNKEH